MFHSLRWRIAALYALLLAVAVAAIGIVIVLRFQSILYQNAAQRVDRTMVAIVAAAHLTGLLDATNESPLETLINSGNVENWESPTTFVQIDAADGAVLNKSSNLGSQIFPANHALGPASPGPVFRKVDMPSGSFLVEDRFLPLAPGLAVTVHVGEPLDALQRTFAQARNAIASIVAAAVLAVIALSLLIARQVTEPINELARTMRQSGTDLLERRVAIRKRTDEIGQLAESFDDLLARLGESFARERQFISDASHELKTPLTSIKANAQLLLRWGNSDATVLHDSLETIAGESGTLAGIVNGMLTLAKADRGDAVLDDPVWLGEVTAEAVSLAQPRAREKGLELSVRVERDAIVIGDASLLRQLASNLIDNAIKFTERGAVRVSVGSTSNRAWLDVSDTGPGIPQDELSRIFERFYRADKARSRDVPGTGLGLAIVSSIARVHGGSVGATTLLGGGASFRATFPVTSPLTKFS